METMIRDISKLLLVDSEHTCYLDGVFPSNEQSDIIQIGWCWLDLTTWNISTPQSLFVKPTRSKVSEYCTNLTGIKPKQAMTAPPLAHVTRTLIKNGTKARPWMTWGYDVETWRNECAELSADFPFSESYFNAQDLMSILSGLPLRTSLEKALQHYGLTFEGTHHTAPDDAYNLARIVRLVCKPSSE